MYFQFFNNTKIIEGFYSNNLKEGVWQYSDINDNLNFSGKFERNQKHGKWTYYYKNKLSSEIFYTQGELDSLNGYHENGFLAYELRFKPDKTGYCISYYPNGKTKEKIYLKNKEIHGVYSLYFENGQLHRETEYDEGKRISILKTIDMNGNALNGGTLMQGQGTYITFYMPQKLDTSKLNVYSINDYKNGLQHGNSKYFQMNGNLIEEGMYEAGNRIGNWKRYKEDGTFSALVPYTNENKKSSTNKIPVLIYSGNEPKNAVIMPEFQGGESQLFNFIKNNVNYPKEARLKGIEGTVIIRFAISELGEIENYQIVSATNELLNKEAIRLIQIMPRWSPGLENGIPVNVLFTLPVRFKLK